MRVLARPGQSDPGGGSPEIAPIDRLARVLGRTGAIRP